MVSLEMNQAAQRINQVYVSIADQEQRVKEAFPFKYTITDVPAMIDGVIYEIFVPKFN